MIDAIDPQSLGVAAVREVMWDAGYGKAPVRAMVDPDQPAAVHVVCAPALSPTDADRLLGVLAPLLRTAGWHVIPRIIKPDAELLWAALEIHADATDDPGGIRWLLKEEQDV
jgi:hypothetical protein